jgi:hypothetical protein
MLNETATQEQPAHQIVADDQVIYEGNNWQQVFLAARMNPAYETIVHLENGVPGAIWGPQYPSQRHPL